MLTFPCPGLDRTDSSSNLLAGQALQCPSEDAAPALKRKGKQSKKLKARGGVAKASAQVCAFVLSHTMLRDAEPVT